VKVHDLFESDDWDAHIERAVKQKAGVIPWVREEDGIKMLFVISSDPRYNGPDPAIIKGSLDKGETPKQGALRECEEEVGIPASKFKGLYKLPTRKVQGNTAAYKMTVFAGELEKRPTLKLDKKEIGEALWLTLQEFQRLGRKTHEPFVNDLVRWAQ